jgi:hypothetical protein
MNNRKQWKKSGVNITRLSITFEYRTRNFSTLSQRVL